MNEKTPSGSPVDPSEPWPAEWREANPAGIRFVHLRTKIAIDHALDAIQGLCNELEEAPCMFFPEGEPDDRWACGDVWSDGVLLMFESHFTPAALADRMLDALSAFDAWAIHDAKSRYVESTPIGPVSTYFQSLGPRPLSPSGLVAIVFDDDERFPDRIANDVRVAISPRCVPVSHFRNGRVFMFPEWRDLEDIASRTGHLHKRLKHIAGRDSGGRSFYKGERCWEIWETYTLFDLSQHSPELSV